MNSQTQPVVAVVVAAGSGSRLGANTPKALVGLGGEPLVRRSVEAMRAGGVTRVVVTIPDGYQALFETALAGLDYATCTLGGPQRQDSVRLGLEVLAEQYPPEAIVLIHDAARPLVPPTVTAAVARAVAAGAAGAIPAVPVHDTIRVADGGVVDRSTLRAVQTPQGFPLGLLHRSHREVSVRGLAVTDDAAVVEVLGHRIELVPGHRDAMKITEPPDLVLAEAILAERSGP
ncbi:MAG: 2-C-methyl-D-erythritol 4-phosphate cytidylyltransferase [Propionibacteriaceae bacterium]|nr:2-C-methyl-D-erythritol 4-phosphate cytidylyltransferase [Propionibacteriaceae bacterium]